MSETAKEKFIRLMPDQWEVVEDELFRLKIESGDRRILIEEPNERVEWLQRVETENGERWERASIAEYDRAYHYVLGVLIWNADGVSGDIEEMKYNDLKRAAANMNLEVGDTPSKQELRQRISEAQG